MSYPYSKKMIFQFFFKESPLYFRSSRTVVRWFVYYYFLLTLLYLIGVIACLIQPVQTPIISSLLLLPSLIGLVLLVVLRWRGGREAFASAGLAGGSWKIWLVYGLGLVAFYGLQTWLNYVFNLGQTIDIRR